MAKNKMKRLPNSEAHEHKEAIEEIKSDYDRDTALQAEDRAGRRRLEASKRAEIETYLEQHGLTIMNGGFYVEDCY